MTVSHVDGSTLFVWIGSQMIEQNMPLNAFMSSLRTAALSYVSETPRVVDAHSRGGCLTIAEERHMQCGRDIDQSGR